MRIALDQELTDGKAFFDLADPFEDAGFDCQDFIGLIDLGQTFLDPFEGFGKPVVKLEGQDGFEMVFQTQAIFGVFPAELLPVPGRDQDLVDGTQLAGQADPDQKVHPQEGRFGNSGCTSRCEIMPAACDMLGLDLRDPGGQEQAQDIGPAPGQAEIIGIGSPGPQIKRLELAGFKTIDHGIQKRHRSVQITGLGSQKQLHQRLDMQRQIARVDLGQLVPRGIGFLVQQQDGRLKDQVEPVPGPGLLAWEGWQILRTNQNRPQIDRFFEKPFIGL